MSSVDVLIGISILLIMLVLSFLFSGSEIAFLSVSRLKVELKIKQGSRAARILSSFFDRKEEIIIAILIGNNIALVMFTQQWDNLTSSFLVQKMGLNQESSQALFTLIQTFSATLLLLVFAEYIPKAIFRKYSDRIVFPLAYLLNLIHKLFFIPILLTNFVSKIILRYIFQVKTDEKVVELGKKDLDVYIQEVLEASENIPVEDLDTNMLSNALSLKNTKARECMIPRTEIEAIPIDSSLEQLMEMFIETQKSKVIIYGKDMDEVLGYIHSHEMFGRPKKLKGIIQPVLVIPETMSANILLGEFTESKRKVAIVVDEFGGTAGMITIEDLIEEVFGEIEDEHDDENEKVEEDMICHKQEDGSYLLGGRLDIDDLNEDESLDLIFPDEEYYTTLGGMIIYYAEDIPKNGRVILLGDYRITVEKSTPTRILVVKVEKLN